jgi:hypothetical protein
VRRSALRIAALAQISYMASGSGSAPAGDGTSPLPFSLCLSCITPFVHTVKGFTRLDPHLVDPNSISRLARICGVAQRGPRLSRLACHRGLRPPRPQVASAVGLDVARRRASKRRRPAARQPRDELRSSPLPQGAEAAADNRSRRTEGIRRRQPILPRILVVRETRRRPSGSGKERRRLVEAAMQNARAIPRLRDEERATAFGSNGCSI